jgi:hypothetical protein
MSTRQPFADPHRPRDRRLISLLARADQAVRDLQRRAASICRSGNLEILGFRRSQLEELNSLLSHGAQVLDGRLYTLDGSHRVEEAGPDADEPITFFAAYRACSRALCAAMKESARLADSTSTLGLRELIIQLEKQLWMIDEPDRSRGREDRRAVSLFLSC